MNDVVRVGVLYPDRLNLYGDRANLRILQRRCEWRGIGFEVRRAGIGDELDAGGLHVVYLSGGQDRDQLRCGRDLVETKSDAVRRAVDGGAVAVGICGGFQLLGRTCVIGDQEVTGLGLVDAVTVRDGGRVAGSVAGSADVGDGRERVLAGYVNHVGRTQLGAGERPLAHVATGLGNNGDDGMEGVRSDAVIGTYVRGPVFALNVWLADWLIARAVGMAATELPPLDDRFAGAAAVRAAVRAAQRGLRPGPC